MFLQLHSRSTPMTFSSMPNSPPTRAWLSPRVSTTVYVACFDMSGLANRPHNDFPSKSRLSCTTRLSRGPSSSYPTSTGSWLTASTLSRTYVQTAMSTALCGSANLSFLPPASIRDYAQRFGSGSRPLCQTRRSTPGLAGERDLTVSAIIQH